MRLSLNDRIGNYEFHHMDNGELRELWIMDGELTGNIGHDLNSEYQAEFPARREHTCFMHGGSMAYELAKELSR